MPNNINLFSILFHIYENDFSSICIQSKNEYLMKIVLKSKNIHKKIQFIYKLFIICFFCTLQAKRCAYSWLNQQQENYSVITGKTIQCRFFFIGSVSDLSKGSNLVHHPVLNNSLKQVCWSIVYIIIIIKKLIVFYHFNNKILILI